MWRVVCATDAYAPTHSPFSYLGIFLFSFVAPPFPSFSFYCIFFVVYFFAFPPNRLSLCPFLRLIFLPGPFFFICELCDFRLFKFSFFFIVFICVFCFSARIEDTVPLCWAVSMPFPPFFWVWMALFIYVFIYFSSSAIVAGL